MGLLDKLQQRICRTVGLSLTTFVEPLAHCPSIASLKLFCKYYFDCPSELAHLISLPYYRERYTCYSDRLYGFSVTIPRCYKNAYVIIFFSRTARAWNSYSMECFPLTYDLNGLSLELTGTFHLYFLSKQTTCML